MLDLLQTENRCILFHDMLSEVSSLVQSGFLLLPADGGIFMTAQKGPVEIDRDIAYRESEGIRRSEKKPSITSWPFTVAVIGVVLIAVLLFVNPENGRYIDSPPPGEQLERDSIQSCAGRIEQYRESYDSLPGPADIWMPSGFTYEKDDELTWSIETDAGLYYSSDIDLEAFAGGEL